MKKKVLFFAFFVGFVFSVFGQRQNIDPFNFQWDRNGGYFETHTDIKVYQKEDITDLVWFESMKQKTNREYTATLEYIDYSVPARPPIIKLGTPVYTFSWAGYYEPSSESTARFWREGGLNFIAGDFIVVVSIKVYCYSVPDAEIVNWANTYQRALMAPNGKTLSRDNRGTFTHWVENSLQNQTMAKTYIQLLQKNLIGMYVKSQTPATL